MCEADLLWFCSIRKLGGIQTFAAQILDVRYAHKLTIYEKRRAMESMPDLRFRVNDRTPRVRPSPP